MKKSLLVALLGAALSFGAVNCGGESPARPDIPIEVDAGNPDEFRDYDVMLSASPNRVSMDQKSDKTIELHLQHVASGMNVANANILLTLDMSPSKTVSFSNSSNKPKTVVQTDENGKASATIYSAATDAQGTITATVSGVNTCNGGAPTEACQTILVTVQNIDNGDGGIIDEEDETYGTVNVSITNESDAVFAEVNVMAVGLGQNGEDICSNILAGGNPGFPDDGKTISISSSGNVSLARALAGSKAVVYAYGLDSMRNNTVSTACTVTSGAVTHGTPTNVSLTLQAPAMDFDHDYDVRMGINFANIMPESWKKWFDLVDNIFLSPVGTGVYYALWYWKYKTNVKTQYSLFGLVTVDFWQDITGDLDLATLNSVCDIAHGGANPTNQCPEFNYYLGRLYAYPTIVKAAEDALNDINGFGPVYKSIKLIGSDLMSMIKQFDVGARFQIQQANDNSLQIHESWTHVVWTWRYGNDGTVECQNSDKTCGRHAFNFAKEMELKDSAVDETYPMTLTKLSTGRYQVTLPTQHEFTIKYGALIKILIEQVVAPVVINKDKDGYTTDCIDGDCANGHERIVDQNGLEHYPNIQKATLGALLNYWIPCSLIAKVVYDWVAEKTANWSIGNFNIGSLITSFLSAETLDGYCEMGLNAAGDYAMDSLKDLVADAGVKVKEGSFVLENPDSAQVPQKLSNLNYKIGVTVEETDEDGNPTGNVQEYNAAITGEGQLANPGGNTAATPAQCQQFLILSSDAAQAACGGI